MWWAIGWILYAILSVIGLFILWMVVRALAWRSRSKRAVEQAQRDKLGPDGRPWPPSGFGLCDHCGRADESIYHASADERLCRGCYVAHVESQPGAAPSQADSAKTSRIADTGSPPAGATPEDLS